MNALLPEWGKNPPPICVPVTKDEFWWLRDSARALKSPVAPPQMHNHGNFIVSLGALCAWLAPQAEALGVEIYPGFAAAETLFDENGAVAGVRIGDMGVAKDGSHKPSYTQGIDIKAPLTVLAEGCRGHLTKQLIRRYKLDANSDPQTYGIGIKELWQLPPGRAEAGKVVHTIGWPLDAATYGGSFIYHLDQDRVAIGFVTGLDYADPDVLAVRGVPAAQAPRDREAAARRRLDPFRRRARDRRRRLPIAAEMRHAGRDPDRRHRRASVNVPKIKGTHQAIRSAMLAAEHVVATGKADGWDAKLRASPVMAELKKVRNIRPGFNKGLWLGLANAGWETITAGLSPWTLKNHADFSSLEKIAEHESQTRRHPTTNRRSTATSNARCRRAIASPKSISPRPSTTKTSRCICTSPTRTSASRAAPRNTAIRASASARPRSTKSSTDGAGKRLQINAANCVHCKTCDIKDPYQIIDWVTPEGGSGPNYQNL